MDQFYCQVGFHVNGDVVFTDISDKNVYPCKRFNYEDDNISKILPENETVFEHETLNRIIQQYHERKRGTKKN